MLKPGPFDNIFNKYRFWFLTGLVVVFLLNVAGFIYHKHLNRSLYVTLNNLTAIQEQYNMQKSMLVLEKSTLESRMRIESVARNNLSMVSPQKIEVVGVVKS